MLKTIAGVSLAWLVCSCGDDGGTEPDAEVDATVEPTGPVATFDVPETGAVPWGAAPFPNEVYRGDDGTLDLGSLPGGSRIWQAIGQAVDERPGFCRLCPIAFPIDGELDPASVPADANGPGASTDPIVLIRADGTGGFIGLDVDATGGFVSVRPAGTRALAPDTRYVAALTDALTGPGGRPLSPSDAFLAIREGSDTTSRAADSVNAALDVLQAAGVSRERVVSVATFTTIDSSILLRRIGAVVDAAAPPTATFDRVYLRGDGSLDALLGTVDDELPGFLPPSAGTEGETAVAHGSVELIVLGTFDAPRIVTGSGTEIGFLRRGADGAIEAGPAEAVPFALTIPIGADPTSMPIAITAVGLPGSRIFGPGMANTFAELGMATISIDPFQNGARAVGAEDVRNEFRGIDGADGFHEHDGLDVVTHVQGAVDNGDEAAFDPRFGYAATAQMISDLAMLVRFLLEGDVSAIAGADPALAGLSFDPDRLVFVGLSYGGVTGVSALAIRPEVRAAVLNVTFGSAALLACQGPDNRAAGNQLASLVLGIRGTFDEVDRRMCLDPSFAFFYMGVEDIYPTNVVHHLFDAPLHDQPPPNVLFQQAGHDEYIGLATGESLLVAMGGPVGGDDAFEFSFLSPEAGPFSNNRITPNGTITVGGWLFGGAEHEMIFRRTTDQSWEAPLRAPFVAREPPTVHDNPTDDVHAQIAAFVQSHLDGGPVTIAAP